MKRLCKGKNAYKQEKGLLHNVFQSIKTNIPFWTIFIIALLILIQRTDKNYLSGIITIILLQVWTYFSHIIGHLDIPGLHWHLFHHQPEKAHQPLYILIETLVNFLFSGGFLLIIGLICLKKILNIDFKLNYYIILFWSLIYVSYHMLNYHYIDIDTHYNHHQDPNTNFSPDWMDILFNTKNDGECFENMNSAILNTIGSLLIVLLFRKTKYDPIRLIKKLIDKITISF
jgi:hypothetical protein